jgi:uncharacterized protein YjbI with pentapeptide repeats
VDGAAQDQELQRQRLRLEVEKLKLENQKNARDHENNDRNLLSPRGWVNLLFGNATVLVAVVLGFVGLYKYLNERRAEGKKRDDARFEEVVKGLGAETDHQRISSAVLLPTFLRPEYQRFYSQVFSLAVGNLRNRDKGERVTETVDPLTQVLSSVLLQSYPLARDSIKLSSTADKATEMGKYLNAAGICLDNVFLDGADFNGAWLRQASLSRARLTGANLAEANLEQACLIGTKLSEADLRKTNLQEADLSESSLEDAVLSGGRLDRANFTHANLTRVTMTGGTAGGANFTRSDLSQAKFQRVDFTPIAPNTKPASVEHARSLSGTEFHDVMGLSRTQKEQCEAKGAQFFDTAAAPTASADSTAVSPTRSQANGEPLTGVR